MPNTNPVCDNASVVRSIVTKAKREGYANVFPIGAASKGLKGRELAEFGLMKEEGIVAVSDDGRPIETADLLRKVLQYASDFAIPVLNHCEEPSLAEGAMDDPKGFMKTFLASHPNYITEQIALGGKARERAEMAIAKGYAPAPGF